MKRNELCELLDYLKNTLIFHLKVHVGLDTRVQLTSRGDIMKITWLCFSMVLLKGRGQFQKHGLKEIFIFLDILLSISLH